MEDLPSIVEMVDREFIEGRRRRISFALRYPSAYSSNNVSNIYFIKDGQTVVSSVVIKRREFAHKGRVYRLAFVGGVCTSPSHRRKGLASAILMHIAGKLQEANIDIAALWATNSPFYQKFGWHPGDCGLFGAFSSETLMGGSLSVDYDSLRDGDIETIEDMRMSLLESYVKRERSDYLTIPLPAERLERFLIRNGLSSSAYAIVGRVDDTGYVYEIVGSQGQFAPLLTAIYDAYACVYINERTGSPSTEWMNQRNLVKWVPQNLVMWLNISNCLADDELRQLYVPFLDRI